MTYETVASVSQTSSLLLFLTIFICVVAYVFWPGNRQRFEISQRRALDLENDNSHGDGQ